MQPNNFNESNNFTNINNLKKTAIAIYILQSLSFLFGITSIIGVMINYIKRDEVKGTWLESHFKWQIKTFWLGLIFTIIGFITLIILIGYVILFINSIWIIYRIIKGFLKIIDEKIVF